MNFKIECNFPIGKLHFFCWGYLHVCRHERVEVVNAAPDADPAILHKSGDRANRPSLMSSDRAIFPPRQTWLGPVTRGRLIRILRIYGALYLMAILLFAGPFGDRAVSLAAGLLFPGGAAS